MRFSVLIPLSLAAAAIAIASPQLGKGGYGKGPAVGGYGKGSTGGSGGACTSNAFEKIHEGHGHNINDGTVGGKQLGLKLPGGSGCYKGQKVGSGSPTLEGPKLGGPKSEGR